MEFADEAPFMTPKTDPVRTDRDRSITAYWHVGLPDGDGWQPIARLSVDHWKSSKSYRAVLGASRIRHEGLTVVEMERYSQIDRRIVLCDHPAGRFNRTALNTFYLDTLVVLRARFAAGDRAVTEFFDPTADLHAR